MISTFTDISLAILTAIWVNGLRKEVPLLYVLLLYDLFIIVCQQVWRRTRNKKRKREVYVCVRACG